MKKKISRKKAEIAISGICFCAVGNGICSGIYAAQNLNWWFIISTVFLTIAFISTIVLIIRNIDFSETDK
ncbi:MAG: hypothetical protein QMB62_11835 [Oscillospiraceae bacterium]